MGRDDVYPLKMFKVGCQWQPTFDILTGYIYHPDTLHAPVAANTVFSTPDDGRRKRPKHVE
jgi:hypothetical protein